MKRRLFCEISPFTYYLSCLKCRIFRRIKNLFSKEKFSTEKNLEKLPVLVFEHSSVIRRSLKDVDMQLQENKSVNLSIATPKVNGVTIKSGQTFSFWKLVGSTTKRKGYKEGLIISNNSAKSGIGGGMCQFTNLLHYLVLHSPLTVTEHHHHDEFDLFPDNNRRVPFGTGTSITYNYLDYRVKNNTDCTFQFITYVTDTHLFGELRSDKEIDLKYEIITEDEHFVRKNNKVYRKGKVFRIIKNKETNKIIKKELIRENNAEVMYNTNHLEVLEE